MMSSNCQTFFLWCMGAIYMFAFSSLYFQIPGLYGQNGILPAKLELKGECVDTTTQCSEWAIKGECSNNPVWMLKNCQLSCAVCQGELPFSTKLKQKFTLLWLTPSLGLNVELGMDLLCLLGIFLSLGVMIFNKFKTRIVFALLWIFYFSLYQVGQTFLWFQWDILLLETGFITIFIAPLWMSHESIKSPHRSIMFWLVKWLLFRLMFASGVVKLTSMCPTWWGLTALNWHYESQCIPTPLSWYAHQFPEWFQKLSVVGTYVIEIAVPFLFFSPVRSLKLLAFYCQVLIQMLIIVTGNYNFFNLLTITLCISLLDDQHLDFLTPRFLSSNTKLPSQVKQSTQSKFLKCLPVLIFCFVVISLIYWTKIFFDLQYSDGIVIQSKIAFTKSNFLDFVRQSTKLSIVIGIIGITCQIVLAFYRSFFNFGLHSQKLWYFTKTSCFTLIAIWLFCISLVPFTQIDRESHNDLWKVVHDWHSYSNQYGISNSYGLFRRMTGVGGRPELVIEGSNNLNGDWKEYNFLYKPGNLSQTPSVVAPHQPRLDWQMWFAALGSYQHNPWFIHLIYKLLRGEKEVINLLGRNPFPNQPPKYIRSRLYKYHYTRLPKDTNGLMDGLVRSRNIKKWWKRDSPQEYTPPLSKDHPSLKKYITDMGWSKIPSEDVSLSFISSFLTFIRKLSDNVNPTLFMLELFILSISTNILKRLI